MIDSPLGNGSKAISIGLFPNGKGMGISGEDGRTNLSNLNRENDLKPKLNNIMTFKSHKTETGGGNNDTLFPVHGTCFNPRYEAWVCTAAGDGFLRYWDYNAKNKIVEFDYKKVPVTKLKLSSDGYLLAYALGYDWANGIAGNRKYKTEIMVRVVKDNETKYNK